MVRSLYEVVPTTGGRWSVRTAASKTDSLHYTRQSAEDRGAGLARANMPSKVVIRRLDGTVEEERTYGGQLAAQ